MFLMSKKDAKAAAADELSDSGDSLDMELMNRRHMEIFQRHSSTDDIGEEVAAVGGAGGKGGRSNLAGRGYASIYSR